MYFGHAVAAVAAVTEQIAEAAIRLLVDRDYATRLGRQGQERVLREFDSQDQQKRFAEYVEKTLLKRGSASETARG